MIKKTLYIFFSFFLTCSLSAQIDLEIINRAPDELKSKVVNINKFTSLFNLDTNYFIYSASNSNEVTIDRKKAIKSLFNLSDIRLDSSNKSFIEYNSLINSFIDDVVDNNYLFNKDTNLFAFVTCLFLYNSNEVEVHLGLKYTHDGNNAYRWSIFEVYSEALKIKYEYNDSEYIPPHSDQLGFLPLERTLNNNTNLPNLLSPNLNYNKLSTFLFLVDRNLISYVRVLKFYYEYYGIPGWIVTLNEFNRTHINSGWLISDIKRIAK